MKKYIDWCKLFCLYPDLYYILYFCENKGKKLSKDKK